MGRISHLGMSFLDRSNIIVTGVVATAVLYSRSAGVLYFAVASVACSITVKIIKRVVQQARPPPELLVRKRPKKSYGMPSTHSGVVTFQAVYVLLACLYPPIHPSLPLDESTRFLPPLIVVPWAVAIMVSRVRLGYHTWAQVLAGSGCGVLFAAVAYGLWSNGWNERGRELERFVLGYLSSV